MTQSSNALSQETSPYLLQHADNPVEWFPWGPEALEKARIENKPILLSIGYSACHWCHVMAHESFADEETAAVMNELYVNIKVDREERPDIDKIYQTAQQLLTQRNGGWPLTMFLTPEDQIPFFGGTYFPNTARHGLPAFKDLLKHIAATYQNKRNEIDAQNKSLQTVLGNIYQIPAHDNELDETIFSKANEQLLQSFDPQQGGFGQAPKFPHPSNIERLLQEWHKEQEADSSRTLHAAVFTLQKMASGGIFDHIGGGFCRYSVDDYWMIPHFEKMLYDNGPLLSLYCEAFRATQENQFKDTAIAIANWVIDEMQSEEGGYYSSLDADSEGEEGKFYVWNLEEIQQLLSTEEYEILDQRFQLSRGPNFEDKYHLHEYALLDEIASELNLDITQCQNLWSGAREKLLAARRERVAPGRDEKILTSWNALMIKGMVIASQALDNPAFLESAKRAIEFIYNTMFNNQRLYASYKDGKAHLNAYLDDYAFLLEALLELLQCEWDNRYLEFAESLAETLLEQFEDKQQGGFYFTTSDHETLIQRPKVNADEATPAGSGIAANSLLKLGYLLGESRYIQAAEGTLNSASQQIAQAPMAYASLLNTFEGIITAPMTIIIRGAKSDIENWQKIFQSSYKPNISIYAIPLDCENLPPALSTKVGNDKGVVAYICEGMQCRAPVDDIKQLEKVILEH